MEFKDQFYKPEGESGYKVLKKMNDSHKNLTDWALKFLPINNKDIILDVGCGGGGLIKRLLPYAGKMYGVDHSPKAVEVAKETNKGAIKEGFVEIVCADAAKLPFKDETFDKVLAVETVYYWEDIEKAFIEIKRVLKKGGYFSIICEAYDDPAFAKENKKTAQTVKNMKIYSPNELKDFVKKAKFNQISLGCLKDKNWIVVNAIK